MSTGERQPPPGDPRALVIRKPSYDESFFSATQRGIVIDEATKYLKRNQLDYNKNNLGNAVQVAGDCLRRGLAIASKDHFAPKDNIRAFIKNGLESRVQIEAATTTALPGDGLQLLTQDGDFLGPLAYDRATVVQARHLLQRFPLSPDIEACETIVRWHSVRTHLAPQLAAFAISTLPPEQYPGAASLQFPDIKDQAGIVRNMLTSLLFRGTPQVVISIEDIAGFVQIPNLTERLNPAVLERIYLLLTSKLNLDENGAEELASYLTGLFNQVRFTFNSQVPLVAGVLETGEENINQRDQLFRNFSKILLLLHPAFEEEKLITDPDQAKPGSYSLWRDDLSTSIDGKRVPTTNGLMRAIRAAKARGYDESPRFQNAISAWNEYKRTQVDEEKKIAEMQAEIVLLQNRIDAVALTPNYRLPEIASFITKTRHPAEYYALERNRARFRSYQQIIQHAAQLRLSTERYIDGIIAGNNGNLPDRTAKPVWVIEEEKKRKKISRKSLTTRAQGIVGKVEQIIDEDFFSDDRKAATETGSWADADPTELMAEAKNLNQLAEISNIQPPVNHPIALQDIQEYIEMSLDILFARSHKKKKFPGDIPRAKKLIKLREFVTEKMVKGTRPENPAPADVLQTLYVFSLKNRAAALEVMAQEKVRIEELDTPDPVSQDWTKDEVEQWEKKVMVETLPPALYQSTDLPKHLDGLRVWEFAYRSIGNYSLYWPKIIPSKDEFVAWAQQSINSRWKKSNSNGAKARIDVLSEFLKVIDNPLFPLSEGEGLKTDDFWISFRYRFRLIMALASIDGAKDELEGFNDMYTKLQKDSYEAYLYLKRNHTQAEVNNLINNQPAKARFLDRIKGLNLVLADRD